MFVKVVKVDLRSKYNKLANSGRRFEGYGV